MRGQEVGTTSGNQNGVRTQSQTATASAPRSSCTYAGASAASSRSGRTKDASTPATTAALVSAMFR